MGSGSQVSCTLLGNGVSIILESLLKKGSTRKTVQN